ncbi:hypothetical protein X777_05439, partial [Ooceraea biroi]
TTRGEPSDFPSTAYQTLQGFPFRLPAEFFSISRSLYQSLRIPQRQSRDVSQGVRAFPFCFLIFFVHNATLGTWSLCVAPNPIPVTGGIHSTIYHR